MTKREPLRQKYRDVPNFRKPDDDTPLTDVQRERLSVLRASLEDELEDLRYFAQRLPPYQLKAVFAPPKVRSLLYDILFPREGSQEDIGLQRWRYELIAHLGDFFLDVALSHWPKTTDSRLLQLATQDITRAKIWISLAGSQLT